MMAAGQKTQAQGNKMLQLPDEVIGLGMPYWENGYLAIRQPGKSTVYLYDRSGKRLWSARIGFQDAVVDEPHEMVRSFSMDGVQLAAYFPGESFRKWPHPASGAAILLHRDRVGLYQP